MGCYFHGKGIPQKGNPCEVFLGIRSWQRTQNQPRLENLGTYHLYPSDRLMPINLEGPFSSWSYTPNELLSIRKIYVNAITCSETVSFKMLAP
jgi:hypothetical protein